MKNIRRNNFPELENEALSNKESEAENANPGYDDLSYGVENSY